MGCSNQGNIRLSTPAYDPLVIKPKTDRSFDPIRINSSGDGIDLAYRSTYSAPGKQVFNILLSIGKRETFTGVDFEADFHHYAKLLTVEYQSADSVKLIK